MHKTFSGQKPSQDEGELAAFVALLRAENVCRFLEIGSRQGDTFHRILSALQPGSSGVACDLPGGLWGRKDTERYLRAAVDDLRARGYRASRLLGDSRAAATISIIARRGPYDAILIDGDHSYDGVAEDWRNYREMARIVAFHDIAGSGQAEGVNGFPVEVPRLWAEIKASGARTVEFVSPGSKMGIGVVWN